MRPKPRFNSAAATPVERFLLVVFGLVFGGAGLTILGSLWLSSDGPRPPLFFRIMGSLIAIAFVAFAGGMIFGGVGRPSAASPPDSRRADGTGSYTCPHCGGGLEKGADVSPHGDAKCSYCDRWFNIHSDRL